jgi:FkbM family methyltransferase
VSVQAVDTAVGRLFVDTRDISVGKKLIRKGSYEPQWTAWFQRAITPGMRIVDIGANLGYYTVLFGTLTGATGTVVACEPDPDNRELLTRNIDGHGLAGHVRIAGVALADRSGTLPLHRDPRRAGVHSLSFDNLATQEGASQIEVPVLTLDELTSRYGFDAVDLMKMDAQGAEALILRGGARTLAGHVGTLVIELWPTGLRHCGTSLDELLDRLECDGFVPHLLGKSTNVLEPHTFDEIRRQADRLESPGSALNAAFARPAP